MHITFKNDKMTIYDLFHFKSLEYSFLLPAERV